LAHALLLGYGIKIASSKSIKTNSMKTITINQTVMGIKHHKLMLFTSSKKIKISEFSENSITFKA